MKTKTLYNLDGTEVSVHELYSENKKTKTLKPVITSALKVAKKLIIDKDFDLGIYYCKGLTINKNAQEVALFTATFSDFGSNRSVNKSNFPKAIAGFAARRLIKPNPFNERDEYMKPELTDSPEYKQWNDDCCAYSLFDNQSFQSSLRQVDYQGAKWDIVNEFFWLTPEFMEDVATQHNFKDMLDDLSSTGKPRYMQTIMENIKFHPLAQKVLNMATALLVKSFPERMSMHKSNPEYHLNAWDAGYAQLKLVWKKHYKDEFKAFREAVAALADYLRPFVYKFKFLYP